MHLYTAIATCHTHMNIWNHSKMSVSKLTLMRKRGNLVTKIFVPIVSYYKYNIMLYLIMTFSSTQIWKVDFWLFNYTLSSELFMWQLVIVNDKLKIMWKEEFVACFNVFSKYLFGETVKNLSQDSWSLDHCWNPGPSWSKARSVNCMTAMFSLKGGSYSRFIYNTCVLYVISTWIMWTCICDSIL
jgi:hypothetical protein